MANYFDFSSYLLDEHFETIASKIGSFLPVQLSKLGQHPAYETNTLVVVFKVHLTRKYRLFPRFALMQMGWFFSLKADDSEAKGNGQKLPAIVKGS